MAKLKYDVCEMGWVCSECGAIYSDEEIVRMFDKNVNPCRETFLGGYCMDCGVKFEDCDNND